MFAPLVFKWKTCFKKSGKIKKYSTLSSQSLIPLNFFCEQWSLDSLTAPVLALPHQLASHSGETRQYSKPFTACHTQGPVCPQLQHGSTTVCSAAQRFLFIYLGGSDLVPLFCCQTCCWESDSPLTESLVEREHPLTYDKLEDIQNFTVHMNIIL